MNPDMSTLLEGVGDEVTIFFGSVLAISVVFIAWWSTNIVHHNFIRTIVILERRSHHRPEVRPIRETAEQAADTGQAPEANAESDDVQSGDDAPVEDPRSSPQGNKPQGRLSAMVAEAGGNDLHVEGGAGDCNEQTRSEEEEETNDVGSDDSVTENALAAVENSCEESASSVDSASVIRRRRLAFFKKSDSVEAVSQEDDSGCACSSSQSEQPSTDRTEEFTESNDITDTDSSNIRIRLKYLNDTQKLVDGRLSESLGDFKRRHFSMEMSTDKLVRLIFHGQVLQSDDETLQHYGLFDNCVVHCLVHRPRSSERDSARNAGGNEERRDFDFGNLLFVLLSGIIGVAWYCRYQYASFFTASSTVALVGLSGIFVVTMVGMYFPDQNANHQRTHAS